MTAVAGRPQFSRTIPEEPVSRTSASLFLMAGRLPVTALPRAPLAFRAGLTP